VDLRHLFVEDFPSVGPIIVQWATDGNFNRASAKASLKRFFFDGSRRVGESVVKEGDYYSLGVSWQLVMVKQAQQDRGAFRPRYMTLRQELMTTCLSQSCDLMGLESSVHVDYQVILVTHAVYNDPTCSLQGALDNHLCRSVHAYRCSSCGVPSAQRNVILVAPSYLSFECSITPQFITRNVEDRLVQPVISVPVNGTLIRYQLVAVMYFGNKHFTARVFDVQSAVYYDYDGNDNDGRFVVCRGCQGFPYTRGNGTSNSMSLVL
jgi:hypothetical protein